MSNPGMLHLRHGARDLDLVDLPVVFRDLLCRTLEISISLTYHPSNQSNVEIST